VRSKDCVIECVTNLGKLNKDDNLDECYTDVHSRNIHKNLRTTVNQKFTHHRDPDDADARRYNG